jgi:hypothetical protein
VAVTPAMHRGSPGHSPELSRADSQAPTKLLESAADRARQAIRRRRPTRQPDLDVFQRAYVLLLNRRGLEEGVGDDHRRSRRLAGRRNLASEKLGRWSRPPIRGGSKVLLVGAVHRSEHPAMRRPVSSAALHGAYLVAGGQAVSIMAGGRVVSRARDVRWCAVHPVSMATATTGSTTMPSTFLTPCLTWIWLPWLRNGLNLRRRVAWGLPRSSVYLDSSG